MRARSIVSANCCGSTTSSTSAIPWRASANPLDRSAENIGQIASHFALIGQARETAGPRQYAEQRHLRQRDGRGAVVDQKYFIACERKFIAASGGASVEGGDEFQFRVSAGSSIPLRVSLVNLQKFTFQAWLESPSMKILAPEQNTRSLPLRMTTVPTFGCRSGYVAAHRSIRCRLRGHKN